MNIRNNTPGEAYYSITSPSSGDCGSLASGGVAEWPGYDNTANVNVSFGTGSPDFQITIPESGTGTVVTVGLWIE